MSYTSAPTTLPEKMYQMLQKKARLSYKRLQRSQGNIQSLNFAFFYVTKIVALDNKVLFPAIISLK